MDSLVPVPHKERARGRIYPIAESGVWCVEAETTEDTVGLVQSMTLKSALHRLF